jgi:hypothetical protein
MDDGRQLEPSSSEHLNKPTCTEQSVLLYLLSLPLWQQVLLGTQVYAKLVDLSQDGRIPVATILPSHHAVHLRRPRLPAPNVRRR